MACMWVIFIVVGVGVWILVTVFRKAEEERLKNLPRPGAADRGPGRRPATDLDRFLEESRRRREAGERPPAAPDAPWALTVEKPPARRRPREGQRPSAAQRPQAPQRPGEPSPAFVPSVRRSTSERRPEMAPARAPLSPAPSPISLAPVILERLPDGEATPAIGLPPEMQTAPPPLALGGVLARPTSTVSPVLKLLPGLLGDPQTVGAVFAMREIFGAPLCRRYSMPTNALPPRS
jgi:hypothetical protein